MGNIAKVSPCIFVLTLSASALAGIHVGDPVPVRIALSGGVTVLDFELPVDRLVLHPCGGGAVTYQDIDDVIGPSDSLDFPVGTWCAVSVELSDDFTLSGLTPTQYPLELRLAADTLELVLVEELEVTAGAATQEAEVRLMKPGWYATEIAPYVSGSAAVDIGPGHARHAALVANLEEESTLKLKAI